jgi:hypothetical protein
MSRPSCHEHCEVALISSLGNPRDPLEVRPMTRWSADGTGDYFRNQPNAWESIFSRQAPFLSRVYLLKIPIPVSRRRPSRARQPWEYLHFNQLFGLAFLRFFQFHIAEVASYCRSVIQYL